MRYTVTAKPDADNALADIWMHAAQPNDVTQAFATIEYWLGSDPLQYAQPDGDGYWIVVPPLAAYFTFSPDDCLVSILRITTVP